MQEMFQSKTAIVDVETFVEAFGYFPDQLVADESWKTEQPESEWTLEDQIRDAVAKQREIEYMRQEYAAKAWLWEMEGVRCATFERDPNKNPYMEF